MLLDGLRSCEVLALDRDDLLLPESQMRVRGKGNKLRWLPLPDETIQLLDHYLRLERPLHCGSPLFVGLKGRARGRRMTAAGCVPCSAITAALPACDKPTRTGSDTMPSSGLCRVNLGSCDNNLE
jgi:integrase